MYKTVVYYPEGTKTVQFDTKEDAEAYRARYGKTDLRIVVSEIKK